MSSRRIRVFRGLSADAAGSLLVVVMGYITVPITLKFVSASSYGFWLASFAILTYLSFVDCSIGVSLVRIVAGLPDGPEDGRALNRAASSAFFLFCAAGSFVVAAGFVIAPFISSWFGVPPVEKEWVSNSFRIAICAAAIKLPSGVFLGVLQGKQHIATSNLVRDASAVVSIFVSIALLYFGWGLDALAYGFFLNMLISGFAGFIWCKKRMPSFSISAFLVNKADLRRLWSFGGYFQLGKIANSLLNNIDGIMISSFLGAAMVVPYVITSKLAVFISTVVTSKFSVALFPVLSQMHTKCEADKIKKILLSLSAYAVRLVMTSGIFLFFGNRVFVSLWTQPQFFGGGTLNIIFVMLMFLDVMYTGFVLFIAASGHLKTWALVCVAETVFSAAAIVFLVHPFKLVGVALGKLIGKILFTSWFVPYLVCRRENLPLRYFCIRGVLFPLLRSLVAFPIIILWINLTPGNAGWVWLLGLGAVSVLSNVAVFEGIEFCRAPGGSLFSRFKQALSLGERF